MKSNDDIFLKYPRRITITGEQLNARRGKNIFKDDARMFATEVSPDKIDVVFMESDLIIKEYLMPSGRVLLRQ